MEKCRAWRKISVPFFTIFALLFSFLCIALMWQSQGSGPLVMADTGAKAPTSLSLSLNGTLFDLGTTTVPTDVINMSGIFSSNSNPLSGKNIVFFLKGGTLSVDWTMFGPLLTTDSLGRYCNVFSAGLLGAGDFQVKAVSSPVDPDYEQANSTEVAFHIIIHPKALTSLTLSLNGTIFDLGTTTLPNDVINMSGIFTSKDVPLGGKNLIFFVKGGFSVDWTPFGPLLTTDYLGRYSFVFDCTFLGSGEFQVKAVSSPVDPDYPQTNSTEVTFAIVAPHSVTFSAGGNWPFVNDTTATGVTVTIWGSGLSDGETLLVYIARLNSTQPTGTGVISYEGATFYDVKITDSQGNELNSNILVTISITSPNVHSNSILSYWDGNNWIQVATTFTPPNTISGEFPASVLSGTPITLFILPEYPLGGILATITCLAAFFIYKRKSHYHI